jgi:hypothetical protein
MYASQILVDPSDSQRIYMMNSFSYSDDGGKEFTTPRQSLHGDDRILWVNPNDSRHVIKGDDGGLGISYDRTKTWLYATHLPLSQFYRVSVDMRKPYWVYGGLQDNGSWMGPSETYRSEGILNYDWIKTGGGDGFLNLVHHKDENTLYTESQYLGLARLDLQTRQRRSIRPGDPKGRIGPRRNWDAWGPVIPEPELGNAMAPANWDGPFFLSHHNPHKIYAGTNKLWKSTDGGDTWEDLGDLTTQVDRRELTIMGERADTSTASLDDGIPYYPTLTAIAESPLQAGVLYVGTDDGQIHVSVDDGKNWDNVSDRFAGLPQSTWVNTIEVSRFEPGTAFVAINNYRNDDFTNYLYKTTDFGQSWTSIVGDLPARRVVRTMREDPKNPNLYYLGTELGLFISINSGKNWVELKNNMPTLAFNDLVIHPRDNDLVLGTHGRGIWILDNLNALQELTPEKLSEEAVLFSIPTAEMINYTREGAHVGNMIFRGENPDRGATIDYYLQSSVAKDQIALGVYTMDGELIRELSVDTTAGVHRVLWDFEYPEIPGAPRDTTGRGGRTRSSGISGPMVFPGMYVAKLTVNSQTYEQAFNVVDDPRLDLRIEDRREWTATLFEIADLYKAVLEEVNEVRPLHWKYDKLSADEKAEMDEAYLEEVKELDRMYGELLSRTRSLYRQVSGWMGDLTTDQESQMAYYKEVLEKLAPRKETVMKKKEGAD